MTKNGKQLLSYRLKWENQYISHILETDQLVSQSPE